MGPMELVTILFFLFTPQAPFGQPAPAATVFRHLPDDAVLAVGCDLGSLARGVDRGFDRLLEEPLLAEAKALGPVVQGLKTGRSSMVAEAQKLGIDPFSDLRYLMAALAPAKGGDERVLVVVGGKLPGDLLGRIGALRGTQPEGNLLRVDDGEVFAQANDGTFLMGSEDWVRKALAGRHSHSSFKKLLADYDRRTWFLAAFRPDEKVRAEWKQEGPLGRPLLEHVAGLSVRMSYGAEKLKVFATGPEFVPVYRGLLDGLGQMATAAHLFARGMLTAGEAYLASLDPVAGLKGLRPMQKAVIETLVTHRTDIRKLAGRLLVGGTPKARVRANRKARSAELTISGGRGPTSMMLFGGMLSYWMLMPAEAPVDAPSPATRAVPAEPAPPPSK